MGWMEKWPSQPGRGARRNPCTAAAAASRVLLAATALLAILSSSRLTSVDAANTDPRVRLDGRFVPGPDDGATGGLPQVGTQVTPPRSCPLVRIAPHRAACVSAPAMPSTVGKHRAYFAARALP